MVTRYIVVAMIVISTSLSTSTELNWTSPLTHWMFDCLGSATVFGTTPRLLPIVSKHSLALAL
jgi:hypothetical protein